MSGHNVATDPIERLGQRIGVLEATVSEQNERAEQRYTHVTTRMDDLAGDLGHRIDALETRARPIWRGPAATSARASSCSASAWWPAFWPTSPSRPPRQSICVRASARGYVMCVSREPLSLRRTVTVTAVGSVVLFALWTLLYEDVRESVIMVFGLVSLAAYIYAFTGRRG